MTREHAFWQHIEQLVHESAIHIDRPKHSAHPRFPAHVYPVDYGYLEGTTTVDGGGIDVWVGSDPARRIVGVICAVDLLKRDAEVKILIGCTGDEIQAALDFHNGHTQRAILVPRPETPGS